MPDAGAPPSAQDAPAALPVFSRPFPSPRTGSASTGPASPPPPDPVTRSFANVAAGTCVVAVDETAVGPEATTAGGVSAGGGGSGHGGGGGGGSGNADAADEDRAGECGPGSGSPRKRRRCGPGPEAGWSFALPPMAEAAVRPRAGALALLCPANAQAIPLSRSANPAPPTRRQAIPQAIPLPAAPLAPGKPAKPQAPGGTERPEWPGDAAGPKAATGTGRPAGGLVCTDGWRHGSVERRGERCGRQGRAGGRTTAAGAGVGARELAAMEVLALRTLVLLRRR